MSDINLNRRRILKGMGWGSLGLTTFITGCSQLNPLPPLPHRNNPTVEDASLWISLRPDGRVEIVSPRSEMGQGISTAIKQIVAEEMYVTMEQVVYRDPRSDRMTSVKATVGSESLMVFGPLIASAAAALKEELNLRARVVYGVLPEDYRLTTDKLVTRSGRQFELEPLLSPAFLVDPLKIEAAKPKSFRAKILKSIVGIDCIPHDIIPIVTGSAPIFVDDISLPDMVYARLVTPPYLSAKLVKISTDEARTVEGFIDLIQEDGVLAVVAQSRSALDHILEKLDITWKPKTITQSRINRALSVDNALKKGNLEHTQLDGKIDETKPFDLDIVLNVPMAAHAAMEPRAAVARFDKTTNPQLEIWATTQDVTLTHKSVAAALSLNKEAVVVHGMRVGGGFGGKVFSSIELDAAKISMKVGKPVKLQWTREDEFLRGYHRPPSEHRIRARVDQEGRIEEWWHAYRSGHVIFSSAFLPPWMQNVTSFVADKGVKRGALTPYSIAQKRIEFDDVRIPVKTGPWRGLGAAPNSWAIETAMNVLANSLNVDPLQFRLKHLRKEQFRLYKVLERAAILAKWRTRQNSSKRAYGVACGIYKDMSYSATITEVSRGEEGAIAVTSMWSVHDCGLVINPDLVRAQVEGNLMWGISMVFKEQLFVEEDTLSATNFDSYDWASYQDAPTMTIDLIGHEFAPSGAGETAIVSAAASVTNALHVLTGKPVLSLPVIR